MLDQEWNEYRDNKISYATNWLLEDIWTNTIQEKKNLK